MNDDIFFLLTKHMGENGQKKFSFFFIYINVFLFFYYPKRPINKSIKHKIQYFKLTNIKLLDRSHF